MHNQQEFITDRSATVALSANTETMKDWPGIWSFSVNAQTNEGKEE